MFISETYQILISKTCQTQCFISETCHIHHILLRSLSDSYLGNLSDPSKPISETCQIHLVSFQKPVRSIMSHLKNLSVPSCLVVSETCKLHHVSSQKPIRSITCHHRNLSLNSLNIFVSWVLPCLFDLTEFPLTFLRLGNNLVD